MSKPLTLPTTRKMLNALGSLYCPAYGDMVLQVHHILTEPMCPTATISCEDEPGRGPYFRCDDDTIGKAVRNVVSAAYVTLILRRAKPQTVPWSERQETENVTKFLKAIDAYAKTRAPLPTPPDAQPPRQGGGE